MNGENDAWKQWAKRNIPPKPADAKLSVAVEGDRKMAALRGDTRRQLDFFLVRELSGTGIGRSAFIMAAMEILSDPFFKDQLIEKGLRWESELPK